VTETEHSEIAEEAHFESAEPPFSSTRQRARVIIIAAVVILIDQLSKLIIETNLPPYRVWEPIPAIAPIFRIFHVSNTGAAFGLFPGGSTVISVAAVLVTIAIIIYNYRLPETPFVLRLALGLQLGGAMGNLIDRYRIGHVTDFLDFGPWPVFNFADLFVVSGAVLLAWIFWQEDRQMKRAHDVTADHTVLPSRSANAMDESNILDEWSTN